MTNNRQPMPEAAGDPLRHELPRRDAEAVPEAEIRGWRGISIVWLVPLVAAVIGIWLAYTTLQERGPTITITFDDAEGLEAGKTRIKYKDVEVGTVQNVRLGDDLKHIVVTAEMVKEAEAYMSDGTRFWVVSPRLGAAGVSGLGTLLSGVYIGIDPRPGTPATEFVGLAEPPLITSDTPGRHFMLRAATRGSISRGSSVYFRGIEVGQVVDYRLADDNQSLDIQVFIRAPHDRLVEDDSRFWNASGLRVAMGANGVQVATESVQALLSGGVAFDTPMSATPGKPSPEGTVFTLYDSYESVTQAGFTTKVPYVVQFDESVRGLSPGAPVEFRGMRIGTVSNVGLQIDVATESVRIPVTIEIEPQRLTFTGTDEKNPYDGAPYGLMEKLVERGLRAQLQSGNLLTGQLLVDLGFHPTAKPAKLNRNGEYPEIPSVASEMESATASMQDVLHELAALPLTELVQELRSTVQSVNELVSSPQTAGTLEALKGTAVELQGLIQTLDTQIGPLMVQAQGTLASAESMVGSDSQTRYDLTATLKELAGAARSIRVFADYLERHPEALIRGKPGFASQ
ncbi:MAG TPA: MlaD family protein [Geminicoccaceae bacterium]|nr:MlaD family protein [Geminicoccaceae bacterium]